MGYADRTVAEIATQLPGATAVFRAHRIDYCCGGARPLAEAAAERSVAIDVIESELAQLAVTSAEPPQDAPALIEHILARYHETHRRELPELVRLAARVEARHVSHPQMPAGLQAALEEFSVALDEHMAKEEQILFPMMLHGGHPMIAAPIGRMRFEHDEHGERIARLEGPDARSGPSRGRLPDLACAVCRFAQADRRRVRARTPREQRAVSAICLSRSTCTRSASPIARALARGTGLASANRAQN